MPRPSPANNTGEQRPASSFSSGSSSLHRKERALNLPILILPETGTSLDFRGARQLALAHYHNHTSFALAWHTVLLLRSLHGGGNKRGNSANAARHLFPRNVPSYSPMEGATPGIKAKEWA